MVWHYIQLNKIMLSEASKVNYVLFGDVLTFTIFINL